MGLIIQDTVTLPSGLEVAGTYASFGTSPLITYSDVDAQGNKTFTAAGNVSYYKDQASRGGGLDPVLEKRVVLPLDTGSVQAIYNLFYAGLAANYQDTTNVQDDVPAAAATTPSAPAAPAAPDGGSAAATTPSAPAAPAGDPAAATTPSAPAAPAADPAAATPAAST